MQTIPKALLTLVVILVASLPSSAQILGIGVQFQGNGTALASTDSAGLLSVAQTNWNVVTGHSFSSIALLQSNGSTGAVLNGSANFQYFAGTSSALPQPGNATLTSGEIGNGWPGSPALTISSIPYATYDVYVYTGIDATGRFQNMELTPLGGTTQTFGYTTEGGGSSWNMATSTATWDGTGLQPSAPSANYVLFSGLTASSFTLNWGAPGNGGMNGFQIVPVAAAPEPSSVALLLLGFGGLVFFVRHRNLKSGC